MINIAVCDDEQSVCQAVQSVCEDIVSAMTFEAYTVSTFTSPVELLEAAGQYSFDLILCDIYMPGISGIEAIQEIRQSDDDVHVIFLTSSKDHAVEAFSLHADNYLVKPFTRQRLADALTPVLQRVLSEKQEFTVLKATDGSVRRINFSRISYAQTTGHNQLIVMTQGESVEVHLSSQGLFSSLKNDPRFFKAGASYILNLDNVTTIADGEAIMVTGERIVVPMRLRKAVQDAFMTRAFETGA